MEEFANMIYKQWFDSGEVEKLLWGGDYDESII